MLVFTRKQGETIHIGDSVVTICRVENNKVRVGIEAAKNIPVHRGEVRLRIDRERKK